MGEHQEQALALLMVKDGLGDFYEEQKQIFLDTILAMPVKEAAAALNSFVEIGFLTREELNENVKKLFAKARPAPSTTTPSPAAPTTAIQNTNTQQAVDAQSTTTQSTDAQTTTTQTTTAQIATSQIQSPSQSAETDMWGGTQPTLETKINNIRPQLARLASISDQELNTLVDSLSQLNVFSIDEVIQTHRNNEKFNFLSDLMAPAVYEAFRKCVTALQAIPCAAPKQDTESETIRNATQLNTQVASNNNMMHHMWSNTAQLLVFPLNNKIYFFCSVESPQTEATLEKGEHLFFLLDVSASMNHNEKGEYCAPKSPDHAASSIKKARDLIPKLAVPALKRNVSVTIIIWNYKIQNTIDFVPLTFQDPESGVFQSDEAITAHVKQHTNETVFKARGGTNIEVALKELGTKMKALTQKVAQINVWFLTDGEETVYLQPDGECAHIPTNPNQGNFLYFSEENEEGTTAYQRRMVQAVVTVRDELRQNQCYMQFHACHLGEAHPIFLKTLAAAVDGHFHTFSDVANIARELNANLVASTAQVTILGREGDRAEVFPAALREGYLYSRGELNHSTYDAIRVLHKPKIRTIANDTHSEAEFSDRIKGCVASIISLERDLENILRSTAENVRMDRLNESSRLLSGLRQRRIEFVTDIPREVRANAMLIALLETVLESVETRIT